MVINLLAMRQGAANRTDFALSLPFAFYLVFCQINLCILYCNSVSYLTEFCLSEHSAFQTSKHHKQSELSVRAKQKRTVTFLVLRTNVSSSASADKINKIRAAQSDISDQIFASENQYVQEILFENNHFHRKVN